jgi:hypothetical protein
MGHAFVNNISNIICLEYTGKVFIDECYHLVFAAHAHAAYVQFEDYVEILTCHIPTVNELNCKFVKLLLHYPADLCGIVKAVQLLNFAVIYFVSIFFPFAVFLF